ALPNGAIPTVSTSYARTYEGWSPALGPVRQDLCRLDLDRRSGSARPGGVPAGRRARVRRRHQPQFLNRRKERPMKHYALLAAASLAMPGMASAKSTQLDIEQLRYEMVHDAARRGIIAVDKEGRPLTFLLRIGKASSFRRT